jgi:hypothetical protein
MLERERGTLTLELEDGRRLRISDRHLTFKLRGTEEQQQRISVYRLRILSRVPEHLQAGYSEPAIDEDLKALVKPTKRSASKARGNERHNGRRERFMDETARELRGRLALLGDGGERRAIGTASRC